MLCIFFISAVLATVTLSPREHVIALEERDQNSPSIELVLVYWKDQQQEKAFKKFLELLANTKTPSLPIGDIDEPQRLYLLANSNANQGHFEDFFKLYLQAYQQYPHHYLAYKGKASILIKIFERTPNSNERENLKSKIVENLLIASNQFSKDISIYKMIFTFAPKNNRKELISQILRKMISDNIIVQRSDIPFFIQHAIDAQNEEDAKQFIEKARTWYPNSHFVDAAETLITSSK